MKNFLKRTKIADGKGTDGRRMPQHQNKNEKKAGNFTVDPATKKTIESLLELLGDESTMKKNWGKLLIEDVKKENVVSILNRPHVMVVHRSSSVGLPCPGNQGVDPAAFSTPPILGPLYQLKEVIAEDSFSPESKNVIMTWSLLSRFHVTP